MTNTAWLIVALLIVTAVLSGYTALLLTRAARLEARLGRSDDEEIPSSQG